MPVKKNVIIVGSKGLVGSNLSNFLERCGHNIFKLDISAGKGKNFYHCNITNEKDVKKVLGKITRKKNIDVVINAAAANPKVQKIKEYKFSEYPLKEWKKNLEIDLVGSFNISKHILKHFEKNNKGKIINISSIYGVVGPDQDIYFDRKKKFIGKKPIEYSVSKSGIIGFTKALASFYKNTKINICCLIFSGIEEKQNKKFAKKFSEKTIMGRMIKKGEYNNLINFIISNDTSYLTGSCLDLSGGSLSIL